MVFVTKRIIKLSTVIFTLILLSGSPLTASAGEQQQIGASHDQTLDMEENLLDSTLDGDRIAQGNVPNPRVVIHENLQEMPEVRTVEHPEEKTDDSVSQKESGGLGNRVLNKSDRLMDLSRTPLTYMQDHVPFFTKRNMVFFGRLELDYANYSSGVLKEDSGFDVRRFRLGLAGQIKPWPDWNYKFEIDLTDKENSLSDAYLSWRSDRWGTFRIGNQKVAQTLSGQTSSISIPFMERPLPVLAFTLKRRLGVGWDTHLKKLGANITLFGIDPNEDVGSHGWATRAYVNPARNEAGVIHLGASLMQLYEDDNAQLRARPESHVTDIRLVDTGVWPAIDKGSALGFEIALARGPFTFRSEAYLAEWQRNNDSNPEFSGWYAEISWFATGEHAQYREGKFIRPKIENEKGAWELALRVSSLDLNDQDVEGGKEDNLSLGVNWYSRSHWRLMGNLIKVDSNGPYGLQNPWIGQVRVQYYF